MKFLAHITLTLLLAFLIAAPLQAATYKLRYVDQNPETGSAAQNATVPLMKKINEVTNGAVEIETYFGETLVKSRDTWDGLKNGIADIGWMSIAYWPGKAPMSDAFGLPGLKYKTASDLSGAMWKAYEKYPEMQQEFAKGGIRPLIFFCTEPYSLFTCKKLVKNLEDLKGMKIRSLGGAPTTQMKALGGIPLSIPMPDNYISLQKGVIDGLGAPAEAVINWRFFEVVSYSTKAPLPSAYHVMAVGEKQWQKLPAEIQEQIMSVCGYEGSRWYSEAYFTKFIEALPEVLAKNNKTMEFYVLTPEEEARWIENSAIVFEEYYNYADSRGVGASARALAADLLNGNL